jgi:phosphoglycerate kinase
LFTKKTVRDIDICGKRVLVRVDYNVPLTEDGEVRDDTRIRASLPTLNYLLGRGAKVILISHLGRPGGKVDPAVRLDPIARALSRLLGREVKKVDETVGEKARRAAESLKEGEVLLLENVRFNPGEKENDPNFARELASLADVFVNDAFGTAHRAHASTVGVTKYLPSVAGLLLEKELTQLSRLLEDQKTPFCVVLGGNKVSDKIGVIKRFSQIADCILLGGGMCFTFLKAKGFPIGNSILQADFLHEAEQIMEETERNGVSILLPDDVVIGREIKEDTEHKVVSVSEVPEGWMGLDIGPLTISKYRKTMEEAKTIFWNGPMGVFEINSFAQGTRAICEALSESDATTIVGGGDSDAALRKFGFEDKIDFISTGGGACLKFLEGRELPGVAALEERRNR